MSTRKGTSYKGMHINVGGRKFILKPEQLERLPKSRLAKLYKLKSPSPMVLASFCDDVVYDDVITEYYFDRDPESFLYIMASYRGVSIHAPKAVCTIRLSEEMVFWNIDVCLLDACCTERLETARGITRLHRKNISERMEQHYLKKQEIKFRPRLCSLNDLNYNIHILRLRLWSVVEDPSSSAIAKMWTVTSVSFILLSLVVFVMGTMHGYYIKDENNQEHEIETLQTIEMICMIWFSIEYFTRLFVAPEKLYFLRQFLNVIDLFTIIPFFIQQFRPHATGSLQTWQHLTQVFRVMRVLRIFRLGRHSNGLKLLCLTLYQSSNELIMLSIFLIIGIVMLAILLYSFESRKLLPNLGEALWFSAVTITTVGYGDIVPASIAGKIVTSSSFLVGVLAIAMPIHPIISNFSNCYRIQHELENAFKRALKILELEKLNKWRTPPDLLSPSATDVIARVSDVNSPTSDTDNSLSNFRDTERRRRKTFSGVAHRGVPKCMTRHRLSAIQARKKRRSCVSSLAANSVFSISASIDKTEHQKSGKDVCYCIFCTDQDDD